MNHACSNEKLALPVVQMLSKHLALHGVVCGSEDFLPSTRPGHAGMCCKWF